MNEGKIKMFWHVVENVKLRGNKHNTRMNEIQFWFISLNGQNAEFVVYHLYLTYK